MNPVLNPVRMGRYMPPRPGSEPTAPTPLPADRDVPRALEGQFEAEIRVSERDGRLRVAVLTAPRSEATGSDPGGPAGDARQILAECSSNG